MTQLRKKGVDVRPVEIEGRQITRTFWGRAWCAHLESFSDFENRLPRGRTYVRNGSVCHLDIGRGEVNALVSGSELYKVKFAVAALSAKKWQNVKARCAGQIGSLLELLQGRISKKVMSVVTDRDNGLFPLPREISLSCSCPDWAVMCKHVAAAFYGVAARLDVQPELLFVLRGVDHEALISAEAGVASATARAGRGRRRIAEDDLADVFGIEVVDSAPSVGAKSLRRGKRSRPSGSACRAVTPSAAKRRSKGHRGAGATKKKPGSAKAGAGPSSKSVRGVRPVTGKGVLALREKFGMSRSQLARVLGVSVVSVGNWEQTPTALQLQPRSLNAWNAARRLTKRQAWKRLHGAS